MNDIIRKVLEKITENGYEAYLVGGFVRDHLLGIESTDIDICTNALPKDILQILDVKSEISYGSISFTKDNYSFEITTYRKDSGYHKRKPKVEYVDDLVTDIKRRDFTINTICMNEKGEIIDLMNGRKELDAKLIKSVSDLNISLAEDPLRMLRAIRFSVIYEFDIDEEIVKFINYNKELIRELSYFRRQEELNRIFSSKNAAVGLKMLKELDLLDVLELSYEDDIVVVNDILGLWAQMKFSDEYPFNSYSAETIKDIRNILDKGELDSVTLFNNNLYISQVAGEILGYDKNEVTEMYNNLHIKFINDLAINNKDLFEILKLEPSPKVRLIMNDVLEKVLNSELENDYEGIKKYLIDKWK